MVEVVHRECEELAYGKAANLDEVRRAGLRAGPEALRRRTEALRGHAGEFEGLAEAMERTAK